MDFVLKLVAAFAAVQLVSAGLSPLVVPETTLLRTPQYDSALIQSDRVGGSFAYSTIEGHSYEAVSPLVKAAFHPVEIQYNLNTVPLSYASPSYYLPNYAISSVVQKEPERRQKTPASTSSEASGSSDNDSVTVESA